LADRHDYQQALIELPPQGRRRWLRQCPQGPARDSHGGILAGDRDAAGMGMQKTVAAVVCGITGGQEPARKGLVMKIVVIGGSGPIGMKLVTGRSLNQSTIGNN
jgi:hypothetical protein